MCTPKKKSFKTKMAALMSKGRLSGTLLFYSYDQDMSDMRPEARYWILVFAKRPSYVFKKNENNWLSMIKVWDTIEDKWVNSFTINYYMHASTSCVTCDHKEELIMFSARGTSYHRAYVYSFFEQKPLMMPRIIRADKKPDPLHWRIINKEFLLFYDELHWCMYDMRDLKKEGENNAHAGYSLPSHIGSACDKPEVLYAIQYIVRPHPRLTIFFIRSESKDVFVALVCASIQKDPVTIPVASSLEVKLIDDAANHVVLNGNLLSIADNVINVERFL